MNQKKKGAYKKGKQSISGKKYSSNTIEFVLSIKLISNLENFVENFFQSSM